VSRDLDVGTNVSSEVPYGANFSLIFCIVSIDFKLNSIRLGLDLCRLGCITQCFVIYFTWSYLLLPVVTCCFLWLPVVTCCYLLLPVVTCGHLWSPVHCQTTSVSMAWCLLMLATHPDIQQKARQELTSVGDASQSLTFERLNQLDYCTCIVKETLRYHDDDWWWLMMMMMMITSVKEFRHKAASQRADLSQREKLNVTPTFYHHSYWYSLLHETQK